MACHVRPHWEILNRTDLALLNHPLAGNVPVHGTSQRSWLEQDRPCDDDGDGDGDLLTALGVAANVSPPRTACDAHGGT